MLADGIGRQLATFAVGELSGEIVTSQDSVWILIRRPGVGGLALRAIFVATAFTCSVERAQSGEIARLRVRSPIGSHLVVLSGGGDALEHLRLTVTLTPTGPTLIPFLPRDLYPLDANDDPLGPKGNVEAAQRGLNSGLIYFRLDNPAFGNVLYFQNLTAMNDYYRSTKTSPDGAVGGRWPELGYLPPSPPPIRHTA